ncbi:MAG TPA: hypothetical protein VN803_00150 [Gemmatimonadales bacterium]|nr:hypothetical protein [Gemmatimonadales bacterium]
MRLLAVTPALMIATLVSCNDPLGPLVDGKPYALARVNGEAVPWAFPSGPSIDAGWIKLVDDTLAQRFEGLSNGPSVGEWMLSGKYTLRFGQLIIDYRPNWHAGSLGPAHPVDTLYASGNGLVLRETGYITDPDTVVRYYARP